MKKLLPLLAVLAISSLTGCSNESGHGNNAGNNLYNSMLNDSNSGNAVSASSRQDSAIEGAPTYEKIDYDFTKWDTTLVQNNYLSMESYPSNYVNKVVKIAGPFTPYESTNPNLCYPAIYLFDDATGCCAYCFEFLLYGVPVCSPSGGNGYPLVKENATIVGRFEKYLEGSSVYIHLVDAIWLK